MLKKLAVAAVGIALCSPALAQYVMSEDMQGFYTTEGNLRAESELTTMWSALPAERQAVLQEECKSQKGSQGVSEAQQQFCNWLAEMN